MRDIAAELEYLLGYKPTPGNVAEAEEWLGKNPDGDLAEWADEMTRIGAL